MKLALIFLFLSGINCECDTYFECLNLFVNSFFNNANYFEPTEIKNDENNIDFSKENINQILSGVSGFLEDELKGTLDLDANYHSFNDNKTAVFVKTFIINDDRNFYFNEKGELDSESIETLGPVSKVLNDNITTVISNNIDDNIDTNEKKPKSIQSISDEEENVPDIDDYSDDNATDYPIIDYIDLYKDTTNEYVELATEAQIIENISHEVNVAVTNETKTYYNESCPLGTSDDVTTVLSWIAAIFVKNETNQYQYHCDGVLLSTHIIVTAAHCVNYTRAEDLIVVLGTTSLQNLKEDQRIVKAITEVIVHENFTEASNDIALLRTLDAIETSHLVSIACLSDEEEYSDAVTTGWAASGELMAIHFDKEKSQLCTGAQDICGVYGNDVTVCPSFGGAYAVKQGGWYIRGIRQGDQTNRAICINEPVHYTPLNLYREWINYYV